VNIFVPAMGRVNTQNRDGSEVRFSNIAKVWQQQGINIDILLVPREKKILEQENIKETYLVIEDLFYSEKDTLFNVLQTYFFRMLKSLFYRYKKNFYDIIYAPSDFLVDTIPALLAKLSNKKSKLIVCLFLVAPNPFVGYENMFTGKKRLNVSLRSILYFLSQRFTLLLLNKYLDKLLVLNPLDKEQLKNTRIYNKIEVVNMGVDIAEYHSVDPVFKKKYDGVFVGRVHPQKGIKDLIAIWEKVVSNKQDAKLALIGGGDDREIERIKKDIESKGLADNIDFLGFRFGKEKIELLKSSNLFIMPSRYESWGMVAVEAMAASLPVVAYDLPIFRYIFPQGLKSIKIGDIDAFSEAVLQLLADSGLREQLIKEGKEIIGQYDWPIVAQKELITMGVNL